MNYFDFPQLDDVIAVGDVCVFHGRNSFDFGVAVGTAGHVQLVVEQPIQVSRDFIHDLDLKWPSSAKAVWSIRTIHSTGGRKGGICEEKVLLSMKSNGELLLMGCIEVDDAEHEQVGHLTICDDVKVEIFQAPATLRACFRRQVAEQATQLTRTNRDWSLTTGAWAVMGLFSSHMNRWSAVPTTDKLMQSLDIEPICTTVFVGWWQQYLRLLGEEAEQVQDSTAFGLLGADDENVTRHPLGMVLVYHYMPSSPAILPMYLLQHLHDGGWSKLERMTRCRQPAPMTQARIGLLLKLLCSSDVVLQTHALKNLAQVSSTGGSLPWWKPLAPALMKLATGTAFEESVRELAAHVLMKCKAFDNSEPHLHSLRMLLESPSDRGRKRQLEDLTGMAIELQQKVQKLAESERAR
jgi:hypothetical protein